MHRQSVMLLLVKWTALWERKIKWVVFQSSRNYMGSSVNWKVWNHFPISLCLKMNNVVKVGIFSWCLFHIQFSENVNWKISLLYLLLVKDVRSMELAEFVGGKRRYILKHLNSLQFWTERRSPHSIKTYPEIYCS